MSHHERSGRIRLNPDCSELEGIVQRTEFRATLEQQAKQEARIRELEGALEAAVLVLRNCIDSDEDGHAALELCERVYAKREQRQ